MDQNLKKIIPYTKPYKTNIVWNIVFNILYALFSSLSFIALIPMMQVLFAETENVPVKPVYTNIFEITSYGKDLLYFYISELTETQGPKYALLLVISLVISTFLFKNLFGYLASYNLMVLKNGVLKDLHLNMYKKIISLPISFYSEKRKGDIMARILGDIGEVQNSFFAILELIVREPLTIVFTIFFMFKISVKLTLFMFVFIPISGFIISKIGKSLKSKSTEAQRESGYFISLVEETLGGLKVIKSYNSESIFTNKLKGSVTKILNLANNIGNKNILASPLSEFLGIVTIAILLWYGGQMVLVDKLPNGEPVLIGAVFLVYMGLAYNILTPAKAISKASYSVKNGLAAAERVFEVLEQKNTIETKENAIIKKGRNTKTNSNPKNADLLDYKYSTGFEALFGYLYLTNQDARLREIFNHIIEKEAYKQV